MSDASVAAALRSDARLVVMKLPLAAEKPSQAAEYAREAASAVRQGQRILILTHTHAACSVFTARTKGAGPRNKLAPLTRSLSKSRHGLSPRTRSTIRCFCLGVRSGCFWL